ncbi:MAG: hypothetical protein Q7W05_01645 [Deltaproteobacteria bacterium]|jgi:hypothetical protein|nr:hypothetical protein [Deltaproteobacteria bacterium]
MTLLKYYPLLTGGLIYLLLIPLIFLGFGEGVFQIALMISHFAGGFISGIYSGSDGIFGVVSFSAIIFTGYLLMQLIQPDSLWIIGLIFLGITQALFWGGWLFGSQFNKPKLLT